MCVNDTPEVSPGSQPNIYLPMLGNVLLFRLPEPPTSNILISKKNSALFMTFQYFSNIMLHFKAQTFSTLVIIFSTLPLKSVKH